MLLKTGMYIKCIDHPEWGQWIVKDHYASNTWHIRGQAGERILDQDEASKFWVEILK